MIDNFWNDVIDETHDNIYSPLLLRKKDFHINKRNSFLAKAVQNLSTKKNKNIFKTKVFKSIKNKNNKNKSKESKNISLNNISSPPKTVQFLSKSRSKSKKSARFLEKNEKNKKIFEIPNIEVKKKINLNNQENFDINKTLIYTFKPVIHKCPKFKPITFNVSSNCALAIYNKRMESARRDRKLKSKIPFEVANYDEIYSNVSERCPCSKKKKNKKRNTRNNLNKCLSTKEFSICKDKLHKTLMTFDLLKN